MSISDSKPTLNVARAAEAAGAAGDSVARSIGRSRIFEAGNCRADDRLPADVAIRVDRATKRFDGKVVLDGINLDVRRGEILVILGGSGSGKSTLLRLMTGALTPEEGRIIVNLPERFGGAIDLRRMTDQHRDG